MNKEILHAPSPENQRVSDFLQSKAESIQVNPQFQLNLKTHLEQEHPTNKQPIQGSQIKILPKIGWAILAIGAFLIMNWAIRSLAINPQPAADRSVILGTTTEQTTVTNPAREATPIPTAEGYDWRGTTLFLGIQLPDVPVVANVYELQPDQPATIESARNLAQRFGIVGDIYRAPGEVPGTAQLLITDNKQRLYVRSEKYFTYYADYARYSTDMFSYQEPLQDEALNYIDEFLKNRGFDFAYQVESVPQIINDYYILPLSPDGFPIRYESLMPVRLEIKLDSSGQVIFVQSNRVDYEQVGTYGIRTAQEAWKKVLSENGAVGLQESMRSGGILEEHYWQRAYPVNKNLTINGRVMMYPSANVGGTPFVSIGDHTATGNIAGLEAIEKYTLIQASGEFSTENGIQKFRIDTWKISNGIETSVTGSLRRAGEQVVLFANDGSQYPLADIPADVPFDTQIPQEELNVSGVLINGIFEWTAIQYVPSASTRGGGGGGGGSGFYKLNLTGTPAPLPISQLNPGIASDTGEYIVQSGDTLSKIAYDHGVTLEELMQLNGLAETNTNIYTGQSLVIPGAGSEQSPVGQRLESQFGLLSITIYNQTDGNQRIEYSLVTKTSETGIYMFILEGDILQDLMNFQNRPVRIWGVIDRVDEYGQPIVNVEKYEIPYPDLRIQLFEGILENTTYDGSIVTTFTIDDKKYIILYPNGDPDETTVDPEHPLLLLEALAIPGEEYAGYPALRLFNGGLAIDPNTGEPSELTVTADQPYRIDEQETSEEHIPSTATIEKVELVYYTPDTRYAMPDQNTGPVYIQPVWRFYGYYSNGAEFEVLVQALEDEYLLPEIETIEPPG